MAQSSEVGLSRSSGELHSAFILCISIHSFIHSISIAPLQVHYYSEAFPTQHGYCVGVLRSRQLRVNGLPKVRMWQLKLNYYYVRSHPFMMSTQRGRVVWLRWMHVDGRRRSAPCGCTNRKLEPTDIILSSSHARKLAFLYQNLTFNKNHKWNKKLKFVVNIN